MSTKFDNLGSIFDENGRNLCPCLYGSNPIATRSATYKAIKNLVTYIGKGIELSFLNM